MPIQLRQRRLLVSSWAVRLALFAVVLIIATALLHRMFDMPTPVALNLFVLAFICAVTAIALSVFAFVRIWQRGFRGTGSALIAVAVSVAILLWPVSLLPALHNLPMINDISTDTISPPAFSELAARPPGANNAAYGGARFARLQKAAYRDLRPLRLDRDPAEVFEIVSQALKKMKLEIVKEDGFGTREQRAAYVEATDRTLVLGFRDDVVLRVVPDGNGAIVDARSASRYGQHDFGRNADRVRDMFKAIVERAEATVPRNRRAAKPSSRRGKETIRARYLRQRRARRRSE